MIVLLFGVKLAYMWLLANKDSHALAYHKATYILDADEPKEAKWKGDGDIIYLNDEHTWSKGMLVSLATFTKWRN